MNTTSFSTRVFFIISSYVASRSAVLLFYLNIVLVKFIMASVRFFNYVARSLNNSDNDVHILSNSVDHEAKLAIEEFRVSYIAKFLSETCNVNVDYHLEMLKEKLGLDEEFSVALIDEEEHLESLLVENNELFDQYSAFSGRVLFDAASIVTQATRFTSIFYAFSFLIAFSHLSALTLSNESLLLCCLLISLFLLYDTISFTFTKLTDAPIQALKEAVSAQQRILLEVQDYQVQLSNDYEVNLDLAEFVAADLESAIEIYPDLDESSFDDVLWTDLFDSLEENLSTELNFFLADGTLSDFDTAEYGLAEDLCAATFDDEAELFLNFITLFYLFYPFTLYHDFFACLP